MEFCLDFVLEFFNLDGIPFPRNSVPDKEFCETEFRRKYTVFRDKLLQNSTGHPS